MELPATWDMKVLYKMANKKGEQKQDSNVSRKKDDSIKLKIIKKLK